MVLFSSAQIYGTNGEVDNTKAVEVFECDIRDSITKIVNYVKRTDLGGSTGYNCRCSISATN